MSYLGHIISVEGVAMDPSKIEAIQVWSLPTSIRALHGFLGLNGYYRKFIKDYGAIAQPLTQLLKKEAFSWSPEAAHTFNHLKHSLTQGPVLQLPDFARPFIVNCDASGSGFGAVLHQEANPIAFYSRLVAPQHAKIAAYERELISLVKVVKHWRPYLWARPFVVHTDHYALKFLLDQRLSTIPQHMWVSKLFGYDFTIEFNPGKTYSVADMLSRRDEPALAARAMLSPTFHIFDEFRRDAAMLPDVVVAKEKIQQGQASPAWSIVDDLVLHIGRVFVPSSSALCPQILATAHGPGHEGVQKTLHRVQASFFNPQAARLVRDYIKGCTVCQRNKSEHLHPAGVLQPLEVPSSVWADIALDFVEGFPRMGGKTVVLTVVDRFSKYALHRARPPLHNHDRHPSLL